MKRKSRDIQIFNLSALDLFASALGAFILISVVLFPFFPNTGQSEEMVTKLKQRIADLEKEVVDLKAQLTRAADDLRQAIAERDEARRERDAARAETAQAKKQVDDMKPKPLDLVIMLDITGSMGEEIKVLASEVGALASLLDAVSPDVSMRVVAYGDRLWAGRVPGYETTATKGVTIESELTPIGRGRPGLASLRRFLQGLSPEMKGIGANTENQDTPEALLTGLQRSTQNTPWRAAAANRRIIVITDAPPYPEDSAAALSLGKQFADSRPGSQVSTIFVKRPSNEPSTQAFLRDLAARGQGIFREHDRSKASALLDHVIEAALR